jgi:carboxymethylenebutenolidase
MSTEPNAVPAGGLTAAQRRMHDLWELHLRHELVTKSADAAIAETMVAEPTILLVPLASGGAGRDGVREFYAGHFIPQVPPDLAITPVSRTTGPDRLVDELLLTFTHSVAMDWVLPGIAPTGRRVSVPIAVIVTFREGRIAAEHLYWDQASVLVQVGLLDPSTLPVTGAEQAEQLSAASGRPRD